MTVWGLWILDGDCWVEPLDDSPGAVMAYLDKAHAEASVEEHLRGWGIQCEVRELGTEDAA